MVLKFNNLRSFPKMEQESIEALKHEQQTSLLVAATQNDIATVFVGRDDLVVLDSLRQNGIRVDSVECTNADEALVEARLSKSKLPLFITSATDPTLAQRFFKNPDVQGFFGEHWTQEQINGHDNQLLHLSGTTQKGMKHLLSHVRHSTSETLDRGHSLQHLFRQALKSNRCSEIIFHVLGPEGTNIEKATQEYIAKHNLDGRARIILHDAEPQVYASHAAEQKKEGVIPVHVECAVFYGMNDLFHKHTQCGEITIADTHHMQLDNMQLVEPSVTSLFMQMNPRRGWSTLMKRVGRNIGKHTPVILSHPSPKFLLEGMEHKWEKAPSNSAALQRLLSFREGDMALTTESARKARGGHVAFEFGSPNMVFTFGTPLTAEEIKSYL